MRSYVPTIKIIEVGDFEVMRDSMVTTVTTAGGGNYSEWDGDEGDYSQGNIAQTTGLSGHSTAVHWALSSVELHLKVYIVECPAHFGVAHL